MTKQGPTTVQHAPAHPFKRGDKVRYWDGIAQQWHACKVVGRARSSYRLRFDQTDQNNAGLSGTIVLDNSAAHPIEAQP